MTRPPLARPHRSGPSRLRSLDSRSLDSRSLDSRPRGSRHRAARLLAPIVAAVLLAVAGCGSPPAPPSAGTGSPGLGAGSPGTPSGPAGGSPVRTSDGLPRLDHVLIAIFENHSSAQILRDGSWFSGLATQGAVFTNAYAVAHPSEPNYLALFSGSTHGLTDDSCPHDYSGQDNLASQLLGAGYSESMPSPGYRGCTGSGSPSNGGYARKHNPWVDFTAVPAGSNLRYSDFPADPARLPTVSFVIPNLCDDMHDCGVGTGQSWARAHLDPYLSWARSHNSLLVVTFDEDDSGSGNHIFTAIAGAGVVPGRYGERIDHYRLLRTLEALYGLPGLGNAAGQQPVTAIWAH